MRARLYRQDHACTTLPPYARCTTRVQQMVDAWKGAMPFLVDAYLRFKANGLMDLDVTSGAWSIEIVGLEECGLHSFTHSSDATSTNETLLHYGYIGATPEKVSRAFPIYLFEIYRQMHRVCPRYSIDALGKTLTNLHQGPRLKALAEQLGNAYDAYLEILRRVDARLDMVLNQDATWYARNVCAPCLYKTEDEQPLKFSFLGCMDGNNSLKLVDSTFRAGTIRQDDRASRSFCWLTTEQVDIFKDKVINSRKVSKLHDFTEPELLPGEPEDDEDIARLNTVELGEQDTDELNRSINICVERWKAAGPEARKKMFMLFAVSGIFLTVCRHGHVLLMCNMIRSRELWAKILRAGTVQSNLFCRMKYPLAVVNSLLDMYGPDIGLGYNIMCAFWKTLHRSSLGAKVVAMRLHGVCTGLPQTCT
ncbi:hypothetical protein B0H14DRAFT_2390399 [Mycena olivaceomarginata]|nr:hypothetical protein B0H14DRAFT_2390399 [Mycena olivaceomarginata]